MAQPPNQGQQQAWTPHAAQGANQQQYYQAQNPNQLPTPNWTGRPIPKFHSQIAAANASGNQALQQQYQHIQALQMQLHTYQSQFMHQVNQYPGSWAPAPGYPPQYQQPYQQFPYQQNLPPHMRNQHHPYPHQQQQQNNRGGGRRGHSGGGGRQGNNNRDQQNGPKKEKKDRDNNPRKDVVDPDLIPAHIKEMMQNKTDSPEDVQAYIEERKKKFPTKTAVEERKKDREERIARGELLEVPKMPKEKGGRSRNRGRERGEGRGRGRGRNGRNRDNNNPGEEQTGPSPVSEPGPLDTKLEQHGMKREAAPLEGPGKRRRFDPTLLEKILDSTIQHERSALLQCFRFLVQHKFFLPEGALDAKTEEIPIETETQPRVESEMQIDTDDAFPATEEAPTEITVEQVDQ